MANIERIVNIQITLETAGASQRGFNGLLLLAEGDWGYRWGQLSSADELLEAPYNLDDTDPVYRAAQQAFSVTPRTNEIHIGRIDAADTSGADTMRAIAAENNSWYGFVDTTRSANRALEYAAWAEASAKLFGCGVTGATAPVTTTNDLGSVIEAGNYFRTITHHITGPGNFPEVALMSKKFATLPGGETWANATLEGVETAPLNETEISNLEARNVNYYTDFRGVSITRNGVVSSGEYIDIIRFRDWLKEEVTVRIFNLMINRRIPYTDVGIAMVRLQMIGALELGQRRGGIVGDQVNPANDGIVPGFITWVPSAVQISSAQKRTRKLVDIGFRATLQGAVHAVEVNGTLTYDALTGEVAIA